MEMNQIVNNLIALAENKGKQYPQHGIKEEILEITKELIDVLGQTINAPSDWREIGEQLANKWNCGDLDWDDLSYEDTMSNSSIFVALDLINRGADECYGITSGWCYACDSNYPSGMICGDCDKCSECCDCGGSNND